MKKIGLFLSSLLLFVGTISSTVEASTVNNEENVNRAVVNHGCASKKNVTVYITKEELMYHATGISAGITVTSWLKKELAKKIAVPTTKVTIAFAFITYAAGLAGYKGVAFTGVKGWQNSPYGCTSYGSITGYYFYK
ncbi:Uncharacterised protein [Macrococcoides caseolyticum]|uniref:hypothetical protein n=1 Tax=Macrococcoides caseolyticum TaxID=69966 RepID=UPI000E056EF4|nr:hypothetical protein [Macrococcus caseolyticus]STY75708.1 Uncharacterised protein [Macrococcus caseolyticus]